jgi:protein TonB
MKKNNMFLSILFLSIALHGILIFGTVKNHSRSSFPASGIQTAPTSKNVKVGLVKQKTMPKKPKAEAAPVLKPQPEAIPAEETTSNEESQGEIGAQYSEANTSGEYDSENDSEYDELLAYIKEYINENLVYPAIARQRNVQGIVTIYFEIEKSGELAVVAVANSSGSSILDRAAISIIKNISSLSNKDVKSKMTLNVNIAYELK